MEKVTVEISPAKYDLAVRGGPGMMPVLPESGDLAFYVKPDATEGGKAGVVVTFGVRLPDGSFARAQAVTTAANVELLGAVIRGWRAGGLIQ